jgi:hypothetical protein
MFVKSFWAVYSVLAKYFSLSFEDVRRSHGIVDISGRFSFQEGEERDFQMLKYFHSISIIFIAKTFITVIFIKF